MCRSGYGRHSSNSASTWPNFSSRDSLTRPGPGTPLWWKTSRSRTRFRKRGPEDQHEHCGGPWAATRVSVAQSMTIAAANEAVSAGTRSWTWLVWACTDHDEQHARCHWADPAVGVVAPAAGGAPAASADTSSACMECASRCPRAGKFFHMR